MGMSQFKELEEQFLMLMQEGKREEAYEMLRQKEAANDAAAVAMLGNCYFHGIVVAKDFEMAMEYYKRALEMGCGDIAPRLGSYYFATGALDEELQTYERGIQLGCESCYVALGRCYMEGRGVEEDETKGFECFQRAAKAGDQEGAKCLAFCYQGGIGTGLDSYSAAHWFKEYLEYEPEDDDIMLNIALCLADPYKEYGILPTDEMLREAFYYAGKAVEKGNVEAHLIVGWFYEQGKVVPQDYDTAYKYIQIAANNGNENAVEHIKVYRKTIYGTYYIP